MSNDNFELDPENFTLVLNQSGAGVFNNNDPSKAYAFKTEELTKLIYGNDKLRTGLMYPVTRYMNPEMTKIIIEQQPTIISRKNGNDIAFPWSTFIFTLDDVKITDVQIYYRPFASYHIKEELYNYPNVILDDDNKIVEPHRTAILNTIPLMSTEYSFYKYYNLFTAFFIGYYKHIANLSKDEFTKELNQDSLPPYLLSENLKTHKDFLSYMKDMDLEKLCYIEYNPIKNDEGNNLMFENIINKIIYDDGNSRLSFADVIKKVFEK